MHVIARVVVAMVCGNLTEGGLNKKNYSKIRGIIEKIIEKK